LFSYCIIAKSFIVNRIDWGIKLPISHYLWVIIILCPTISLAQSQIINLSRDELRSYRGIKPYINKIPSEYTQNIDELSTYLGEGMSSDLEKVRSIYLWIAGNITYDMKAFIAARYEGQTIPTVLEDKKAICEGYANLFSALCTKVGVENAKILGYSKGYGYDAGQKFAISNHAWNAVRLRDEWFLLDVTWAASNSNVAEFQASSDNLEKYFLTEPHIFLIDHLPEDPEWQLIQSPITLDEFETGKNVPSGQKKKKVNLAKDIYGREIAHYERVIRHNPTSKEAHFRLGYAHLSKALDTLESIHQIDTKSLFEELNLLELRIHHHLEMAEKSFSRLGSDYANYEKAQTLIEECQYQKGVFHYEAGFQILSLLVDMDKEEYFQYAERYGKEVNSHWDLAIGYFEEIKSSSLYYEQAQRYITYFIPEYRP